MDYQPLSEVRKTLKVKWKRCLYLVPFVESENEIFLKTIIPSRKATKRFIGDSDA